MVILLHLENAQHRLVENGTMKLENGILTYKEWVVKNSPFDAEQKNNRCLVFSAAEHVNSFEADSPIDIDLTKFNSIAEAAVYVNTKL